MKDSSDPQHDKGPDESNRDNSDGGTTTEPSSQNQDEPGAQKWFEGFGKSLAFLSLTNFIASDDATVF